MLAAQPAVIPFVVKLLDPVDREGGGGGACDVGEHPRAGRRRVGRAVLPAQEKDGHLRARHGRVGAELSASAPAGNRRADETLDEGMDHVEAGDIGEIGEVGSGQRRRRRVGVGDHDGVQRPGRKGRGRAVDLIHRRRDEARRRGSSESRGRPGLKAAAQDGEIDVAGGGAGRRRDARDGRAGLDLPRLRRAAIVRLALGAAAREESEQSQTAQDPGGARDCSHHGRSARSLDCNACQAGHPVPRRRRSRCERVRPFRSARSTGL